MTRRIVVAALAFAVMLPSLGATQERRRSQDADRERPLVRTFSFNRVRLGVTVQTKADPETDRYGAMIMSVTEDGPADKAGLQAGDIITRFGSTSLSNAGEEDGDVSGPGLRLVELARELDDGDSVKVEYRRDGSAHTATIVAQESGGDFAYNFKGPEMALPRFEGPKTFQFHGEPGGAMRMFEGPEHFTMFMGGNQGLQMLQMNADLGEYFGTDEGLLVTHRSSDSSIPIRTGDVILSIDGRKPASVSHAYRIIGSYEEGETVRVEVMRKRQRVNVEWTVKEQEHRVRLMQPTRRPLQRELRLAPDRTRM